MRKKLQKLDFPQRCDGKLSAKCQSRGTPAHGLPRLTPSFSLCMMIFFSAHIAPVLLSLARCTSLVARWSAGAPPSGRQGPEFPRRKTLTRRFLRPASPGTRTRGSRNIPSNLSSVACAAARRNAAKPASVTRPLLSATRDGSGRDLAFSFGVWLVAKDRWR